MSADCIFCNIVNKSTNTEILHETEDLIVFNDINPHAPVHLLIVPKRHVRSINDLEPGDHDIVSKLIFTGRDMAREKGIHESGYRLFFNVEKGGGQVIFHLHLHMVGGW